MTADPLPLSYPKRPPGRPIVPETPLQAIEGAAYEAITPLVYYRDADAPARLTGDAGCDEAVRRMERAFRNGDAPAFWAAADDYWTHDADEDAAALRGDGRVGESHRHLKTIPAMVEEMEVRS